MIRDLLFLVGILTFHAGVSFGAVLGERELVGLHIGGFKPIVLEGRVDTGAKTSSLSAFAIQLENAKGLDQVVFSLKNSNGEVHRYRSSLSRQASVKSASKTSDSRYFIKVHICLKDQLHEIEVSLKDRRHMSYPILLGRNVLKEKYLVDVAKARILGTPSCEGALKDP